MGQPEKDKRSQAERIAGIIESAQTTPNGGVELELRIYLPGPGMTGPQSIRPRRGFRDRGGTGTHAGVPCGQKPERLMAALEEIIEGARP